MAKVVRIGDSQYKKLKGMADSYGVPMSNMLDILMDRIKGISYTVKPAELDVSIVIDEGFKQMVEQYPTVAQVEKQEGKKRNGNKAK